MDINRYKDKYTSFAYLRSAHYMGLSLYILLLAFFIALTSLFEMSPKRADSVMSSVKESFYKSSLIAEDIDGAGNPSDMGQAGLLPEQQVKKLMGKSLGDLKIEERTLPDGRFQLAAILSSVLFENYIDAFAKELAVIITNDDLSTQFETEIIIDTSYENEALFNLVLERFENNNYPMQFLTMGFSGNPSGKDIKIKFIFEKDYNVFKGFNSAPLSDKGE